MERPFPLGSHPGFGKNTLGPPPSPPIFDAFYLILIFIVEPKEIYYMGLDFKASGNSGNKMIDREENQSIFKSRQLSYPIYLSG